MAARGRLRDEVTAQSGLSVYLRDTTRPSRPGGEQWFTDRPPLVLRAAARWSLRRAGQPESLVEQVRGFFRIFR